MARYTDLEKVFCSMNNNCADEVVSIFEKFIEKTKEIGMSFEPRLDIFDISTDSGKIIISIRISSAYFNISGGISDAFIEVLSELNKRGIPASLGVSDEEEVYLEAYVY